MKAIIITVLSLVSLLFFVSSGSAMSATINGSAEGEDSEVIAKVGFLDGIAGAYINATGINAQVSGSATGKCIWWETTIGGDSSGTQQAQYTLEIPAFGYSNGESGSVTLSLSVSENNCRRPFQTVWIFGRSDVERYWHFKGQEIKFCKDSKNFTCMRARYYMDTIISDNMAHSAYEFEEKYPLEVVYQFNPVLNEMRLNAISKIK